MRPLLAACAALLMALPAAAAPSPASLAARLDAAREAWLATQAPPFTARAWDARYRTSAWFWQQAVPRPLAEYDGLVRSVAQSAWAADPGDPFFRRKGIWVRPYASDATDGRVLEVFDRAQAMGATEVYLETFYNGRTAYDGGRAFPARWPGLDVARVYAREARYRGIKLYAWVHTLRWGEDQLRAGWAEPVVDGWGRSPASAEGPGSAFVSPSSPAVRARLGMLIDELAGLRCFDGVWLDYLRYPVGSRGLRPLAGDPRDYWGYAPSTLAALAAERPDLDTPEFRAFLRSGLAPDDATRTAWLGAWRAFLTRELREVLADARARLTGKARLGIAFHPGVYLRPHDPRAQNALAWLPLCDEAAAMCYAYDPALDPRDDGDGRATIDRELAVVEQGIAALHGGRRPALLASLAADPPGAVDRAPGRHWSVTAQVAYLKGRRVEGAYGALDGVALFSYGWLWPASDARRKAGERMPGDAGRAATTPL